jgi:hypothetical protein
MAVLVGNGTVTPVIGTETIAATIAPGAPLDNISVYFVGGTGGSGPLLLRLYAEVGGFQTLVAQKQAVGSNLPSIIAWDTGLGPLAGGGGGGSGGGNAVAQSNQIHAGGTNYTVTVTDLSSTPASLSSPRQPVTITIAGVDQFDTAGDAEFGTTFALAPGATGTLTVFPGYAQHMDVAIDQTNIPPFVTVTVTADCGGGSVLGALVASAQMSGTDSTIGEVFGELKLPVATEYFVSMKNNSQQAINITLTGVTTSESITAGGVVALGGDVIGPSNANTVVKWENVPLDPATFAAPGVAGVPVFNGTDWEVVTSTEVEEVAPGPTRIFAAFASYGTQAVQFTGFGAGGGGGGGASGVAGPGSGGGGGGGGILSTVMTQVNLAHTINVIVGTGGAAGAAGAAGLSGGAGGNGGNTYVIDATAGVVLAAFAGGGGGAGGIAGGAAGGGGAPVPNGVFAAPASGGSGGTGTAAGSTGNDNISAINTTNAVQLQAAGTGGTGGAGNGPGGGGGGAGPNGVTGAGNGGNGTAGAGGAGTGGTISSGGGGGGGAGSFTAVTAGGAGAAGGSGLLIAKILFA